MHTTEYSGTHFLNLWPWSYCCCMVRNCRCLSSPSSSWRIHNATVNYRRTHTHYKPAIMTMGVLWHGNSAEWLEIAHAILLTTARYPRQAKRSSVLVIFAVTGSCLSFFLFVCFFFFLFYFFHGPLFSFPWAIPLPSTPHEPSCCWAFNKYTTGPHDGSCWSRLLVFLFNL